MNQLGDFTEASPKGLVGTTMYPEDIPSLRFSQEAEFDRDLSFPILC